MTTVVELTESPEGVTFSVKLHPKARRNEVTGVHDGMLKVAVTAPPTGGKANQALVDLLAELLDVPRTSVALIAGATSRKKTVRVRGLAASSLRNRLDASMP